MHTVGRATKRSVSGWRNFGMSRLTQTYIQRVYRWKKIFRIQYRHVYATKHVQKTVSIAAKSYNCVKKKTISKVKWSKWIIGVNLILTVYSISMRPLLFGLYMLFSRRCAYSEFTNIAFFQTLKGADIFVLVVFS